MGGVVSGGAWQGFAGAVAGGLLAILGGYLAARSIDRRERRARVLSQLATEMEIKLDLLPGDVVGPLWCLADKARREAMATARRDTRLTHAMLDALDDLRQVMPVRNAYGDFDGSLARDDAAVVRVRSAFDDYLLHLSKRLRVPLRRHDRTAIALVMQAEREYPGHS